ncbi:MAG TPA: amidohydrolase family protein, partial [Chitinophagaceae bacterium]|nr:amidohydrolase family protein [Chitinophagaceae bacterium]
MKRIAIIFLLAFAWSFSSMAQRTIIWCGSLIDGIADEPQKNMTIVVEKNRISSVEKGFTKPGNNDKLIDLKTKTVTPGWMDMHVHLEFETNPNRYLENFTQNPADYAFKSVKFADVTLMAGFTTVRDLGGSGVNISLRNAIARGDIKGL